MEEPVQFDCKGKKLYGILHVPGGQPSCRDIVIMITGGPQTRYGSHRLYVQLARFLCESGLAVFRFDYEGMGDSEGEFVGARYMEPSIHAAVRYIDARFPEGNRKTIWSLCDGATASALYSFRNNGLLAGLILCNPILHYEAGLYRKHYYTKRLFDRDLWVRLLKLKIDFREVFFEIAEVFHAMLRHAAREKLRVSDEKPESSAHGSFLQSLRHTRIPIRCILSGNDVVAEEFREKIIRKKALQGNENVRLYTINKADHTFSVPGTKDVLFSLTANALREMGLVLREERRDPAQKDISKSRSL